MPRYCLFGLNVALTEKLESNSQPMRIHISETCQELLPQQYKIEERTGDPSLREKLSGLRSFFLNSKDGRKPLKHATLKALLPTDAEAPKLKQEGEEMDSAKESKKAKDKNESSADASERSFQPNNSNETTTEGTTQEDQESLNNGLNSEDKEDGGSIYEPQNPSMRRVSSVNAQYCGGFKNSTVCNII